MGQVLKLFKEANKYLVGGVNSPVRSFNYAGVRPVFIKNGRGAFIYDYEGKAYIDYVLSWGSLILGHGYPQVIKDVKNKISSGLSFGLTNKTEIELAKEIKARVKFIDKIRFVNSGTEAVMAAIRLARGFTGRAKILKFEHSYHGSADYLLAKGGSGLATLQIATSGGVPQDFLKHTLIVPFGDLESLKNIFSRFKNQIAAVILEPVGGNYGVVPPDINFLKQAREISVKQGTLLIFDEVITGFRFRNGSMAQEIGVTPDLVTFGKIIGGGLPIGAVAGRAKIMDNLAPLGKVYQASTFSGNPVVMQAGLSTLKVLGKLKNRYPELTKLADELRSGLAKEAKLAGIELEISGYKSMFSLRFRNKSQFSRFYRLMLDQGIFFAPSEFEANFISFAHKKSNIRRTINAARFAFKSITKKGDSQ